MFTKAHTRQIKVWDPFVRLFHWGLVGSFLGAWYVRHTDYSLHLTLGYVVAGLVLFRLVWGFAGTYHARFSSFVRGPFATLAYMRNRLLGRSGHYTGHNPAGAAMIVAFLLVFIVLTASGVALDSAENRAGLLGQYRLYPYLASLHTIHTLANSFAFVLTALHLLGVMSESIASRQNLVHAMITGRKHKIADNGG